MNVMEAKYEAAARHLPVARVHDAYDSVLPARHPSETRLQAAVVAGHESDEKDPYADVPCTD
jgi:hypothetical protein